MVVRHGHDQVELAAARAHEHGVGRKGSLHIQALGACGLHRRGDETDFLIAEEPAFAGMRVEARHSDARPRLAPGRRGLVRDLNRLQHGVEGHGIDGLAQRDMDADQHHAQLLVRQHHAHRRRRAARRGSQGLQHLGMAGVRDTGGGQRLLVDGRSHDGLGLTGHHQTHRRFDAACGRSAVAAVDPAQRQRSQARGQIGWRQHRQTAGRHVVAGRVDHGRHGTAGAPHHDRIADHHTALQRTTLEGAHDDLGADAGRVAHGHQHGFHAAAPGARGRHAARTCAQAQLHVLMPDSRSRCGCARCPARPPRARPRPGHQSARWRDGRRREMRRRSRVPDGLVARKFRP